MQRRGTVMAFCVLLALAGYIVGAGPLNAQTRYTVTDLGTLGNKFQNPGIYSFATGVAKSIPGAIGINDPGGEPLVMGITRQAISFGARDLDTFFWSRLTGIVDMGSYPTPVAINARAEVVGLGPFYWHPSLGQGGQRLIPPANPSATVTGMNDASVIIGGVPNDQGHTWACIWLPAEGCDTAAPHTYNDPHLLSLSDDYICNESLACRINAQGDILGCCYEPTVLAGDPSVRYVHIVVWINSGIPTNPTYGKPFDLGITIWLYNNSSMLVAPPVLGNRMSGGDACFTLAVAGWTHTILPTKAFTGKLTCNKDAAGNISCTTTITPVAGTSLFGVRGINDEGDMVGNMGQAAVVIPDGSMQLLGDLFGQGSTGNAINNLCQVVGVSKASDDMNHGFIWSAGTGMKDLNDLLVFAKNEKNPYRYIGEAKAITDDGWIVGSGVTRTREWHGYLLMPVK